MSESSPSARRALHLVVEGFSEEQVRALINETGGSAVGAEIFPLTEATAKEALEKIFAADSVAVWAPLETN